jgi:hypothetical protein
VNNDWRVFRPAIWLAMLGVALVLLVNPAYIGALVLGFSLGVAIRIERRRRAPAPTPARRRRQRRR